jgi:protein required for attachment to host cells
MFAREVAGFLQSRAQRGEFGGLVLIAPARFLGLLRELLPDLLEEMSVRTLDKDLTAVKPHELIKVLEEVPPAI